LGGVFRRIRARRNKGDTQDQAGTNDSHRRCI
jgi:hypothetical protein